MLRHMEWRTAVGFTDYEISDCGEVRRRKTKTRMRGFIDADGYIRYPLRDDNGVRLSPAAHKLVIEAFVGPAPGPGYQIAHGDGSRINCHFKNLRWATACDNQADRHFHGNGTSGEKNPRATITEEDVNNIRKEYRRIKQPGSGRSVSELDRRYNLCRATIIRIAKGISWTHVPMPNADEDLVSA